MGTLDLTYEKLTYQALSIPEEMLHEVRMDIYHSSRPGYHIFREFVSPELASHMATLWSELPLSLSPEPPYMRENKVPEGCANFGRGRDEQRIWQNFFWNPPIDELTYDVSLQVQRLRNRVELRKPYSEVLPLGNRAVSFRVTISTQGSIVPPHRDWVGDDYDPARTQATLFLTTRGVDYSSGGFAFEDNHGVPVDLGEVVRAGDLVLWRYGNLHWVDDVQSTPPQKGFIRVLFPAEEILKEKSLAFHRDRGLHLLRRRLTQAEIRLAESEFGRRYVAPAYRALKGRR